MANIRCYCEECKHITDNGWCAKDIVYIDNSQMTAAGMLPICTDYEEDEDGEVD